MRHKTNDYLESHSLIQEVKTLLFYGINVVPMNQDKQPSYPWKKYQTEMFTIEKVDQLFHQKTSIATINGEISGGLYTLDFEGKSHQVDCVYDEWAKIVAQEQPELCSKLVRYQTAGGGVHIRFRCREKVFSSTKLASEEDQLLIELLGEGKLAICPPTPKYNWLDQTDWNGLDYISADEVENLLEFCRKFDKNKKKENEILSFPEPKLTAQTSNNLRPGEVYNATDKWRQLLTKHGWRLLNKNDDGIEYWVRQGKELDEGPSATWSEKANRGELPPRKFYVFSSNCSPLEENRSYSPFELLTFLEYKGDFKKAASFLGENQKKTSAEKSNSNHLEIGRRKPLVTIAADSLMTKEIEPTNWIIESILASGLTIFAGPPKAGKSLLSLSLSLSVANGLPALGYNKFQTKKGDVIYCALEDPERRLQERLGKMMYGMGLDQPGNIEICFTMDPLGGDMFQLEDYLQKRPETKLVIVDVWSRAKQEIKNAGNAYFTEYKILAPIQSFALKHNIALVLVHHTNKSDYNASIYDAISGTRAIQAAADTIMIMDKKGQDLELIVEGRDVGKQDYILTFDEANLLWSYDGIPISPSLKPEQRKVVNLLIEKGTCTTKEIAKHLDKQRGATDGIMKRMVDDGIVIRIQRGKFQLNEFLFPSE